MSGTIPTPLPQRLADFRRGPLTLVVWLVAAATVAVMMGRRGATYEHVGRARTVEYEISASSTGRLEALAVDVFEPVRAGQVLLVLDGSDVAARLATASAELARLEKVLESEAAQASTKAAGVAGELRSFQMDEQRLRLEILAVTVDLASDRVELARLDLRLEREEKLASAGLAAISQVDDARLARAALAARIEEIERLLAGATQDHREAGLRRQQFAARYDELDPDDPALAPLAEAVRVQERRVAELELERSGLLLRAPVDGRISEVRAHQGQAVLAGQSLVVLVPEAATEVLAYVPEHLARTVGNGTAVRVASATAVVDSVVESKGPSVTELPRDLWRNPAVPEYGVPMLVRGLGGLRLLPGERVSVRIASRGSTSS